MVMINRATKEITLKIVYYGPGLCGKTTNLEFIYAKSNPDKRGKLLTVATETDRTLFFDFLPMELGTILGMKLRVQLYTVPGQVFYDATRRIVLRGSDGVVFVADSQKLMMDANWESLENMKKNLVLNSMNPDVLPLVFQYNKRDLPDLASVEELERALNWRGVPSFEAVATAGKGVNETVRKIIELVIRRLHEQEASLKHPQRAAEVPPSPAPPVPPPPVPAPPPPSLEDTSEELAGVEVETEFSVGPDPAPPPAPEPAPAPPAAAGVAAPSAQPAPGDFPLLEMPAKVEPLPELEEPTGSAPLVVMEGQGGGEPITEELPQSAVESEEGEVLPEEAIQAEVPSDAEVQVEIVQDDEIQVEVLPESVPEDDGLPEVAVQVEQVTAVPPPEIAVEVEVSDELEELPPPPAQAPADGGEAGAIPVEAAEDRGVSEAVSVDVAEFRGALDDILLRLRGIVSEVEDLRARMADLEDRLPK